MMKQNYGEQIMEIKTGLDYLKEKQAEAEIRNDNQHRELKSLIIDSIMKQEERDKIYDAKYANKLVERIVYGLVGLIIITVFTLIIKGVLA